MVSKSNRTLKDILDVILYMNPSTQQEIADKLGISRRYVTKLMQPLIQEGIVKRSYMIDLDSYEQIADRFENNIESSHHSENLLITSMLKSMRDHVKEELRISVESLLENDYSKADEALKMDFTTNTIFEKVKTSVETVVSINQQSHFSKTVLYNEIAYDLERIGDYCGHIAKFVVNDVYEADDDLLYYIKKMYKLNEKMINYSMEAFLKGKIELKDDVMDLEEKMHELQKNSLGEIATQMVETSFDDKERSNYYIYISRVVKAFERIGDICVEIVDTAGEFHKNIPRTITPRTFRE
ncbi:PhoU domain-containing protein [uncultured Methanobrevibacter sp.]|uniref:phosphate signaling complex PhoU family protein n=1 Tax=uncultured Methanobrevibacter sp. TaxID=253161 RepID=UPI0025FD1217|nr:PhoU domain-containing protein [uncultured Methanobrevibacter sp.]